VRALKARYALNSINWKKKRTRNRKKKEVKEVVIKSILTYDV